MGDRVQPVLDHPSGRARVDEKGLMEFIPFAACGSGKIVEIVVSDLVDLGRRSFCLLP
jgi:hypothetical protein